MIPNNWTTKLVGQSGYVFFFQYRFFSTSSKGSNRIIAAADFGPRRGLPFPIKGFGSFVGRLSDLYRIVLLLDAGGGGNLIQYILFKMDI